VNKTLIAKELVKLARTLISGDEAEEKDHKRIRDMIEKANGNADKLNQYASNMAKAITGADAAEAFARKMSRMNSDGISRDDVLYVAKIFNQRAKQLT
jgi:hypothetical protein